MLSFGYRNAMYLAVNTAKTLRFRLQVHEAALTEEPTRH